MNKQQIIDQAMQLAAGIGNDPLQSPVIDGDMTAEDLLPHAFRYAYRNLIETGGMSLQDVIKAHTITCTVVGSELQGVLPVGVLTEYLDTSFLPAFPYSAFLRYFPDYRREKLANLLCYYTVNNNTFYTSCGFDAESDDPVDVVLHAASIPTLPDDAATDIDMSERARDVVIMTLAMALR